MSQIQINTLVRCPYCHDSIMERGPRLGCAECLAWHHAACLVELGRCGGCAHPNAEPPSADLYEAVEEVLKERARNRCHVQPCRSAAVFTIKGLPTCEACSTRLSVVPRSMGAMSLIMGLAIGALMVGLSAAGIPEGELFAAAFVPLGLPSIAFGLFLRRKGKGLDEEVRAAKAEQARAGTEHAAESSISVALETEGLSGKGEPDKALCA